MEPKIHVSRNRDSLGVFTEDQLRMAIARGSVYASDFCWRSGMKEWVAISQAYPQFLPSAQPIHPSHPPFPAAGGSRQTHAVGRPSHPSAPPAAYAHGSPSFPSGGDRLCAYLLDGLFMTVLCCAVMSPFLVLLAIIADSGGANSRSMDSLFRLVILGSGFFGSLLYYGILGNTSQNATWGQRIMGFRMTDSRTGAAPESGQVWRWALYRGALTSCCGCIGFLFFIPILDDARKQSAFDRWADILMVRR